MHGFRLATFLAGASLAGAASLAAQSVSPQSGAASADANTSGNVVTFTVTNDFPSRKTFTLQCGKSGQVTACFTSSKVTLNGGASANVNVTFSTGAAGSGTATLTTFDGLFEGDMGTYNITVGTPVSYGVSVTPDGGSLTTASGSSGVTTSFTVTNTGNVIDWYNLSCGRTGQVTSCSVQGSVGVNPGTNASVTVTYATSSVPGSGTLTLSATSQADPTKNDGGSYTVTVPVVYGVNTTPDGGSKTAWIGSSGNTAAFTVTNTGNATDTYSFGCTRTGQVSSCGAPGNVTLAAGANTSVTGTFTAGLMGSGTLTVTATSLGSGSVSNAGSYNVTVQSAASSTSPSPGTMTVDPNASGNTAAFTVTNNGNVTDSYSFQCTPGVQVTACTPPGITSIAAGASANVNVTFSTGAGGSGTVSMDATSMATAESSNGSYNVTVRLYQVAVTPDGGSLTTASGSTASATFTVQNTGNVSNTFSFTCGKTSPVLTCTNPAAVTLGASASTTRVVTYTTGNAGTGTVTLTASGSGASNQGSFNVTVPVVHGVTVAATGGPLTAPTGTSGSASFTVTNTGNATDTYSFACTPGGTVTSCPNPASVTLGVGANTTVTATYQAGAAAGSGSVTLSATSLGSPPATVQDVHAVTVELHSVAVTPAAGTLELIFAGPGEVTFTVTNDGSVTNAYALTCPSTGSISSCTPAIASVTLAAAADSQVVVNYEASSTGTGTLSLVATTTLAADTGSYTVGPAAAPSVTAVTGPVTLRYNTPDTVSFTVRNNTITLTESYDVSCSTTGQIQNCSSITTVVLAPQQTATVDVTYQSGWVGNGSLTLAAASPDCCEIREDSASTAITVTGDDNPPTVALWRHNDDHQDRSLCLTVAAGQAARLSCGDLLVAHGMPAYRTMGRNRSLTLLYNSATAWLRPTVPLHVTIDSTTNQPDTVRVELLLTAQSGGTPVSEASAAFASWLWSDAGTRQIVLAPGDANDRTSGIYPFTAVVQHLYNGSGALDDTTTGDVLIVNRRDSRFGVGWWMAGMEELAIGGDWGGQNRLLWVGGDGSAVVYDSIAPNLWLRSPAAHRDTIARVDTTYTRSLLGGVKIVYDYQGRHIQTINRLGHTTTFAWHPTQGTLDSISVPPAGAGGSYTLAYGPDGLLDMVTDPAGRSLTLTHTGTQLTSATDADGIGTGFAYNTADRIVGRTTRRGYTTSYVYGWQRVTRIAMPFGNGAADSSITSITPWDERGFIAGFPSGALAAVDTVMAYTSIDGPRTDVTDITNLRVDRWGAPVWIQDPLGRVTTMDRDSASGTPALVTRVQEASGRIAEAWYNARGLPDSVVDRSVFDNDADGIVDAGVPGDSAVFAFTRYEYDTAWSFPTKILQPTGEFSRVSYAAGDGVLLWVEDARGLESRVTFTHDPTCGLPSTVLEAGAAQLFQYGYDARCNLDTAITPAGRVTSITNGAIGLPTYIASPGNRTRTIYYDMLTGRDTLAVSTGPADQIISENPPFSSITVVWPPQSLSVARSFDADGNVIKVRRWGTPSDVGTVITQWRFDAAGRQVAEIGPDGAVDSLSYNQAGQLVERITRRGDTLTMTYDAVGRTTQRTLSAVTYQPESYAGVTFPLGGGQFVIGQDIQSFTYDAGDRLLTANNNHARIARNYEPSGLMTSEVQRIRDGSGSTFNNHAYTLTWTYDLSGRRRTMTLPPELGDGGRIMTYRYASFGPLEEVGFPDGTTTDGFVWRFGFDSAGRIDTITNPNNTGERWNYDPDGRLERRTIRSLTPNSGFPGDVIRDDVISRDPVGQITQVINAGREMFQYQYAGLGAVGYSSEWYWKTPDDIWQATRLEFMEPDALGNNGMRLVQTGVSNAPGDAFDFAVPGSATGRLHRQGYIEDANYPDSVIWGQPLVYDPAGNVHLTERVRNTTECNSGNAAACFQYITFNYAEVMGYFYDADGRMVVSDKRSADTHPNENTVGGVEEMWYDALGRRVKRIYTSDVIEGTSGSYVRQESYRYVWDGSRTLYEIRPDVYTNPSSDTAASPQFGRVVYVEGSGIDRPLAAVRVGYDDNPLFVHLDYRDKVSWGTLTSGLKDDWFVNWASYHQQTFGQTKNRLNWQSGSETWYGSLIAWRSDENGQVYLRNRYFDPQSGRFTQEDPIGLAGGLNLYGFAGGNPVNFSDPFGLCTKEDGWTDCDKMISAELSMKVLVTAIESGEWTYAQAGNSGDPTWTGGPDGGDCTDLVRYCTRAVVGDAWASQNSKSSTGLFRAGNHPGFTRIEPFMARPGDIIVKGGHAGVFIARDADGNVFGWANNGSPTLADGSGYNDSGTGARNFSSGFGSGRIYYFRPIRN